MGSSVTRLALLVAATAFVGAGCKDLDPPAAPPFQIFVKVESDPGKPVIGAVVTRANKVLATTGADGRGMLTLLGAEGETTDVNVKCPDAYTSPVKATSLRLTRFADRSKVPEYGVTCPPMLRRVVVAVKADNGANLPVVYLNRIITRTDISGAAHFALEVAPGAQFQVALDTAEQPRLKPTSPSKPFMVGQHDDIMVWEQKFDVERVRTPVYVAPKIQIPKKLGEP